MGTCTNREAYKEAEIVEDEKKQEKKKERRRIAAEAVKAKETDGSDFVDMIPFMKEKEEEPEYQLACLLALFRYTAKQAGKNKKGEVAELLEVGTMETILAAMVKHQNDKDIQLWGSSLLWAIAAVLPEKEEEMVGKGAIEALLRAAEEFPDDIPLLHQVFGAIRNLVIRGEQGKKQVLQVDRKDGPVLVRTLKDSKLQQNELLQEQVVAVLFCVTSLEEASEELLKHSLAGDLLSVMTTHPDLAVSCTAVIRNLATNEGHRTILGLDYDYKNVIDCIIQMAKAARESNNTEITSIDPDERDAFLKQREAVPQTLIIACEALANLTKDHAVNVKRLVESGGIERIVSTILLFTNPIMQIKGLDCLHSVALALQIDILKKGSQFDEKFAELLRHKIYKMVSLFKHLLKTPSKGQNIEDRSCEILEILSSGLHRWSLKDVSKSSDFLFLYLVSMQKKRKGEKINVNHEYEVIGRVCRILGNFFAFEMEDSSATALLSIRSARKDKAGFFGADPYATPLKKLKHPIEAGPMGDIMKKAMDKNILTHLFKILASIRARRRDYKAKPIAIEGILRVLVCYNDFVQSTKETVPDEDAWQRQHHVNLSEALALQVPAMKTLRDDVRNYQASGGDDIKTDVYEKIDAHLQILSPIEIYEEPLSEVPQTPTTPPPTGSLSFIGEGLNSMLEVGQKAVKAVGEATSIRRKSVKKKRKSVKK